MSYICFSKEMCSTSLHYDDNRIQTFSVINCLHSSLPLRFDGVDRRMSHIPQTVLHVSETFGDPRQNSTGGASKL